MKVYVVYENTPERLAAANLARVLNVSGHLFANATAEPQEGGQVKLVIQAGPRWPVEATVHDTKDVKPRSKTAPPRPKGARDLIFDDEE